MPKSGQHLCSSATQVSGIRSAMKFLPSLQHGVENLKPSLFQLLSEPQLATLLPPLLRYLLTTSTHRYQRYLLTVLNSFDKAYAPVMLLVERHFLRTYGGSPLNISMA
jgi:hypothetical protein